MVLIILPNFLQSKFKKSAHLDLLQAEKIPRTLEALSLALS